LRHSVVFWLSEMISVKHRVRITATETNERMLTAADGIDGNLLPRKCHTLDTLHREKERMSGYLGGRVFDSSARGRPTTRRKDSVRFWIGLQSGVRTARGSGSTPRLTSSEKGRLHCRAAVAVPANRWFREYSYSLCCYFADVSRRLPVIDV